LFDAFLPLESYKTAPLGYLREGMTALKDADAILISRSDQVEEEKVEALLEMLSRHHRKGIPIGRFSYVPTCIVDCFDRKVMDLGDLKGKKVIALTAIASPDSFYHLIESHGAEIVNKLVYPDHYFFNHQDRNEILVECVKQDAIVVTSEKDMVKLRKVTKDSRIVSINIEIKFLSGEDELLNKVRSILNLDYT
jgi:tetraacyldisaccharide 4'-kinase